MYHLITVTTFALSPSITPSVFHSRLKTRLFHKSFPPQSFWFHLDCPRGSSTWTELGGNWRLLVFVSSFIFFWLRVPD